MAPADSDDDQGRAFPPGGGRRLKQRLSELDKRLAEANKADGRARPSGRQDERRGSAMGKAFRLSTEMVAGVFVGGFIGWVLDRWFGTAPFLLIVFLMLGIVASIMNAIRAAKEMQKDGNP
jgi:ATP synthase protein I